ncbi:MAG: hypothetical protein V8S26_10555 [Lachnospiraceae bacterium]
MNRSGQSCSASAISWQPGCVGRGKKCSCVAVSFRTLDFKNKSHQCTLSHATDVTDEIYQTAKQLFKESWKQQPLRLIGVSLTNLSEDEFVQMSLFENPKKAGAEKEGR